MRTGPGSSRQIVALGEDRAERQPFRRVGTRLVEQGVNQLSEPVAARTKLVDKREGVEKETLTTRTGSCRISCWACDMGCLW
jgi:hypothetical protein